MTYSVSSADVAARWRPLSSAETALATTLIGDAVLLLDTARPALAAAVAASTVPERLVTICVAEAVIRVLQNPDLLSNQSVSADGGVSQGFQFSAKTPAPRMRLSLLDLTPLDTAMAAAGVSSGIAGSLRTINSTPWTKDAAYCGSALDVDDLV